jgi:phospholipase C
MRIRPFVALMIAFAALLNPLQKTSAQPEESNPAQAIRQLHAAEIHAHISHVVIVVQENRSVDNFFMGLPGADTVQQGMTPNGPVPMHPVDLDFPADVDHQHKAFVAEYNQGKMDGWTHADTLPRQAPTFPYAYVPEREIRPYCAGRSVTACSSRTLARASPRTSTSSPVSPHSRRTIRTRSRRRGTPGAATHRRTRRSR